MGLCKREGGFQDNGCVTLKPDKHVHERLKIPPKFEDCSLTEWMILP